MVLSQAIDFLRRKITGPEWAVISAALDNETDKLLWIEYYVFPRATETEHLSICTTFGELLAEWVEETANGGEING